MKIIVFILICCLAQIAWAVDIKHSDFNFQISTHKIKSTDIHYAFVSVDQNTFVKEAGPFSALGHQQKDKKYKDNKHILFRAVFPVKKAIGYFDADKFSDPTFIKKMEGGAKVKRARENAFITQNSSPIKYHYFSRFYFDSDDLSSLPDSRIGRKIMELKSTDPLLFSANLSIFREMFGHTHFIKESSEFYGFVALDENTTLVVFMRMSIYSSDDILDYVIERDLIKKTKKIREAFEQL